MFAPSKNQLAGPGSSAEERVASAWDLEEHLRALDASAALDVEGLETIPEHSSSHSGSSSGGSAPMSLSDSFELDESSPELRRGGDCGVGCLGRGGGGVSALESCRPLRRHGAKLDDALSRLPVDLAKRRLLEVLDAAEGEPRDRRVVVAAADLAREWHPASGDEALVARLATGRWTAATRPRFPGEVGKTDAGACRYALGRMSFGLFAPADVVVEVEECRNVVRKLKNPPPLPDALVSRRIRDRKLPVDPKDVRSYDVETRFAVADARGAGLRGALVTRGFCAPAHDAAPDAAHRLDVWFVGGDLYPVDDGDAEAWSALFGAAHLPRRSVGSRLGLWFASVALGIDLEPPEPRGVQRYTVARPVVGYVDVLYADADLRVTRGNRGSLVVTRR